MSVYELFYEEVLRCFKEKHWPYHCYLHFLHFFVYSSLQPYMKEICNYLKEKVFKGFIERYAHLILNVILYLLWYFEFFCSFIKPLYLTSWRKTDRNERMWFTNDSVVARNIERFNLSDIPNHGPYFKATEVLLKGEINLPETFSHWFIHFVLPLIMLLFSFFISIYLFFHFLFLKFQWKIHPILPVEEYGIKHQRKYLILINELSIKKYKCVQYVAITILYICFNYTLYFISICHYSRPLVAIISRISHCLSLLVIIFGLSD